MNNDYKSSNPKVFVSIIRRARVLANSLKHYNVDSDKVKECVLDYMSKAGVKVRPNQTKIIEEINEMCGIQ